MSDAPTIVLASASPRRRELLAGLGVRFEVRPAAIDERSAEPEPARRASALALAKARAVGERARGALVPSGLVLGADTIVVAPNGELLGKPADDDEAASMLHSLRGREHQVVTAVAVVAGDRSTVEHVVSRVTMRAYSDAEIAAYVAGGSPFDKAGSYAIQDRDFAPVDRLDGCECAVIGLPLWTAARLLREIATIEAQRPSYDRCADCPQRDG